MTKKYFIGIDEVGRGPLAGPITVCALMCEERNPRKFSGIKDSKKLTEEGRESWLKIIREEKKAGRLNYAVASSSHKKIDGQGLTRAVSSAISRALKKLECSVDCTQVLLDGGLHAPAEFEQETIIKGDEKERIIAMASIVAKVFRDKKMCRLAKKYPEYGFEIHKGYGTKKHYEVLKKCGPCEIHRRSFKNLT